MGIPEGITPEHIDRALADLDAGAEHSFGNSRQWEVVSQASGQRHPPKAVVGLAARSAFGLELRASDFQSGPEKSQAVGFLRSLGYAVVPKGAKLPTISMEGLVLGHRYDRPHLARLWGYRSWQAIGRGIVTPAGDNKLILFITKDKQGAQVQYRDHFEGDELHIEGETNHAADNRILNAKEKGDEIWLFYRDRHHSPFTFYGQVELIRANEHSDQPSHFVFQTRRSEIIAGSSLETETITHGDADFIPDEEGTRKLRLHVEYERSAKNRAKAIEIHGTTCKACGFDFNEVYGEELARDYIEVHHRKSITETDGRVDPATDLVPLCSNCHSMVHRDSMRIMPVEELRGMLEKQGH